MTARYGIIVDLNRCTGCMTCVLACKEENLTPPGVWWDKVLEIEGPGLDYISYVRYACMHCDNPPCVPACPEKAIYKRADGIVIIDQAKCHGRGECRKACPYGVIDINPEQDYFPLPKLPYQDTAESFRFHPPGKATKCTLCVHRVEKGREPACVEGCPSRAMIFGDLNDPGSPIRAKIWQAGQLLESEKANPKVFYVIPKNLSRLLEERIVNNPQMDRLS
ncbi:MAG: 4Fe-4S dicluster domain-containing protein [Deltaproteobacteria bacterium]|nr:4Fe-4S dicluster domain-containing protein [Deltaproteobacteria bacterium]